jgi:hypothetical protein
MRSLSEPVVWTNLLFFVNALAWYAADMLYTGTLVALTGAASFMYHILRESEPLSKLIDHCCAHAALVWTVWVSVAALNLGHVAALSGVLALGLWLKSYAHKSSYEVPHTLWHVCVFVGQLILATACCVY